MIDAFRFVFSTYTLVFASREERNSVFIVVQLNYEMKVRSASVIAK